MSLLPCTFEPPSRASRAHLSALHAEEKKLQEQHTRGAIPCHRTARPGAGGAESCHVNIPQCWRAESNNTQNRLWGHTGFDDMGKEYCLH